MLPQFSISPARRNRLILIVLLLLLICWMLYVAKSALFPYIIGLVVAYLVLPLVNFLDRRMPSRLRNRNLARPLSIVIVYLMIILFIAGVFAFLIPPVVEQGQVLWKQMPQLAAKGRALGTELLGKYQEAIPLDIRQRIQSNLEKLAGTIGQALQEGITRTVSVISSTVSFFLGILVIPFWLFYILNDETKVREGALALIPDRIEPDLLNIMRITDDIFSAYIRGQLILCLFIGVLATIGLLIAGVDFALLLGLIAGAFEILPFVGPILGAIPALIVAALQSPMTALWTLVVFIIIQQIENLFLAPKIAGESVKLHPALVMVVLVVGNEALGLWGMLLAVPLTAVIRDIFKYLYLRFSDEEIAPEEAMARVRTEKITIEV
ncbi:MAG TPA: AI-2E family transporter [Anaerolineae bacterium]|nr:AI-2E family transporter [Anaerolineae bacterium]